MKYVARVREILQVGIHTIGRIDNGKVVSGEPLPLPYRVEIETSEEDGESLMYRYTRSGELCGDTWHEDLESAFDQAAFEYGLKQEDFLVLHGSPQGNKYDAIGAQQFIQTEAASQFGLIQALGRMETWQPITEAKLNALLAAQLANCLPNQQQLFERSKVIPHLVPIARSGKIETVFVVAKVGDVVLYYEDVEEGFNISRLAQDGSIATPGYEQWELRHALWHLAAA